MSVVLIRTDVDRRYLTYHQSQSGITSVDVIKTLIIDLIGQLGRDVIGRLSVTDKRKMRIH